MRITLGEVAQAYPALHTIAEQVLPVKDSIKVARLLKKLKPDVDIYDAENTKICEKFGKQVEGEPGRYEIVDLEGFNKGREELCSQEAEYNGGPIQIDAELQISAHDLIALEKFIDFDKEE